MGSIMRGLTAALFALGLSACSATFRNHGYVPDAASLRSISVGGDTRETVATKVGRPATNGVERDDAWYYIQSRVRHYAYRAPEFEERQLVAVSFAADGRVANVERFGLERGRVVTLSRRTTQTSIQDFGLVQQILRNFGRIDLGQALADS